MVGAIDRWWAWKEFSFYWKSQIVALAGKGHIHLNFAFVRQIKTWLTAIKGNNKYVNKRQRNSKKKLLLTWRQLKKKKKKQAKDNSYY